MPSADVFCSTRSNLYCRRAEGFLAPPGAICYLFKGKASGRVSPSGSAFWGERGRLPELREREHCSSHRKEADLTAGPAILIRGTNWIGDSVMSLAAIREIRRLYPDRHLALAVRPWVAGLLGEQGLVDEILSLPEGGGAWAEAALLKQRSPGFETAVVFPNSFATALSIWLAGIRTRLGYHRDGRGVLLTRAGRARIRQLRRHQAYYYLDLLFQTGLSPVDYLEAREFAPDIRLRVPPQGRAQAEKLLDQHGVRADRPRVVINPGATYGAAKRWFPERYAEVADALAERAGAQVLLVGSAGERPLAETIRSYTRHVPYLLTGQTSLPALLGIIGACHLFITNDSGPMHLAAALNAPQLALFGSTDEVATGPLSRRARVLHKHVACSPCLLRECPLDLRCFERISVAEVRDAALEMLASANGAEG